MAKLASLFVSIQADDRPANRTLLGVRRSLTSLDRQKVQPKITLPAKASADLQGMSAKLQALARQQVRLNVDSTTAKADVATLTRQLATLQQKRHNVPVEMTGGIDKDIAEVQRDLAAAQRKQTTIPLKLERIEGKIGAVKSALNTLERDSVDVPVDVDKKRTLRTQLANVRTQMARTLSSGREVEAAGASQGRKFGSAFGGSAKKALGGLALVTGAVAGIAGLATGFGKSITKAAEFEKSMRNVGIQTGQTGDKLKVMTDLAMEMGKETSFSAQGASDAMLELAKGGLSAAQIQAGALEQTLTLATAGGLELGAAASYMVQGLNTFGLEAREASRVSAALAGAANASTASVEDMGAALSQVGPGAKIAGLSIEDTAAALAAFTNNGMKGSDAGTSLKTMLTRLVPSTQNANAEMQRLGLITDEAGNRFFDAQGNMKSMTEVAGILQEALKGQAAEQKIATLATIFGSDASRAAAILAKEGAEGLAVYMEATSNTTAAQDLANEATKGYAGALERFKGAVETAQIQLGSKFLPILSRVLDYLSGPGIETFQGIATIVSDTFAPAISGAEGGLTKLINYLSRHQADVVEGFKAWGDGVFDFGIAVAKMTASGLRQFGDFAQESTRSVMGMIGSLIRGFDSIPGIDLSESVSAFEDMEAAANTSADNTKSRLYGVADSIDKGVVPSIEGMKKRFDESARKQILTAKQRDAVAAVTQAIEKLGTKSDGTQIQIKRFKDISTLASGEQRKFYGRLNDARRGLAEQLTAAKNAGAGQKELTKTWEIGKRRLYDEFVQMGLSKKEAGKLAEKYAGVQPKIETKVTTPGMSVAQREVMELRRKIREMKDKDVDIQVGINLKSNALARSIVQKYGKGAKLPGLAGGGAVQNWSGMGRRSYDTELAALRVDEHVWTPEEVDGAGGHGQVKKLRAAAKRGDLRGFANGGAVTRHIDLRTRSNRAPNLSPLVPASTRAGQHVARVGGGHIAGAAEAAFTKMALDAAGGGVGGVEPGGNNLVSYKGGRFTENFANRLKAVAKAMSFFVFQGGFRPATSYSGTSHRGDAVDVGPVSNRLVQALRSVRIAAWDRTGKGNWAPHIHGVPLPGAGRAAGSAVWQAQDYLRGGDGLEKGGIVAGRRGGITTKIGEGKHDELVTPLPSGWNLQKQDDTLKRIENLLAQRGTGDVHFDFVTHNPIAEPQSVTTNKALQRVSNLGLV
jgi:TP901 family phage tail tape measure protein